jgi:hypothetical protein
MWWRLYLGVDLAILQREAELGRCGFGFHTCKEFVPKTAHDCRARASARAGGGERIGERNSYKNKVKECREEVERRGEGE